MSDTIPTLGPICSGSGLEADDLGTCPACHTVQEVRADGFFVDHAIPEPAPTKLVCALCPHPEHHDIHDGPADTENLHLWEPIEVPDLPPEPDEPCGLCGGEFDHVVHNGETYQGVEPHDYISMTTVMHQAEARLRGITAENVARAKKLARGEPPMQLDNASMANLRMETLLNHVLRPGSLERLRFEHYFQTEVDKALDDAFSQQAKLRLGVDPTASTVSKLRLPGR